MLGILIIAAAIGFQDLLSPFMQIMMILAGIVSIFYPVITLDDDSGNEVACLEYPNDVLGSHRVEQDF